MQAGLGERVKELLRVLVDGDSRHLAVAVEDKFLQDTFDVILIVCGVAAMLVSGLGQRIRSLASLADRAIAGFDMEFWKRS